MIECEAVFYKVKGGEKFLATMEEMGLEDQVRALGLEIARLADVWQISAGVREIDKEILTERIAALFYVDDPRGTVKYLIRDFARLAASGGNSFEEGLAGLCNSRTFEEIYCLRELARGLGEIDPMAPAVFLVPTEDEQVMELSLRPKGLTPATFLLETANGLTEIKGSDDKELRLKRIVAYSWLIDLSKWKTIKTLNWLGIGPEQGAKIVTMNPNYSFETENRGDREKIISAAVSAIPLAGVNIARFLRLGLLPKVGVLEMTAEDFWGKIGE